MHAHWKVSLAACTLLLFYGVLASAADMNDCQNPSVMEGPAGIIRTSTLVGTTVLDPQNQALGRIKDVLLDAQTGRASFVVLDAEATHASHAMLVVPYDALRVGSYPRSTACGWCSICDRIRCVSRRRFQTTSGRCSRTRGSWSKPAISIRSGCIPRLARSTTRWPRSRVPSRSRTRLR